jgi:chromosome segregation ATPase
MLKEDGDYCWNYWRNVNERIGLKHQGIQTTAFEEAKREAEKHTGNALQSNPYEILQGIKEVQKNLANLYLSREQRDELRHTLNDAWDRAQARIGEIREVRQEQHEEWVRRQGERKERHEEWRQRMTVNMERWDGDVKTAEEEISQLTQGIQGLQEEVAQATKAEYTRVLERMITGKQGEITKIRDRIADLHRRIDDVKGNLERVTEAEPTTASLEG